MAIWTRATEPHSKDSDPAHLLSLLTALREEYGALAAGYDRLHGALRVAGAGTVAWDEHGNEVFSTLERITADDPAAEAVLSRSVTSALKEALAGTEGVHREELFGPPNRSLEILTNRVYGREGFIGVVAVVNDVSSVAQIESLRRDLVINVSHELRTPVGALSVLAETLAAEVNVPEPDRVVVSRLAGRMDSEANRLARLVNDLLSLATASDGSIQKSPVRLGDVIRDAVARIASAAEIRSVGLAIAEVDESLMVNGDIGQLISAVYNLLDNAVKYSETGSTVELLVRRPQTSMVAIDVVDTGLGIAMRDRERIFERFYRVDKARARDTGGTGLGLAIVRNVARAHGGEVAVRSIEGQGSTFTLLLPLELALESVG